MVEQDLFYKKNRLQDSMTENETVFSHFRNHKVEILHVHSKAL